MKTAVTPNDLLTALQRHVGAGNGISAEALAGVLCVAKREVRFLVTELRLQGTAVCGTPRDGYYIAATAEEVEETCQFLRGRAMHSLTLEAALRKLTLPDLLGQMKLKT